MIVEFNDLKKKKSAAVPADIVPNIYFELEDDDKLKITISSDTKVMSAMMAETNLKALQQADELSTKMIIDAAMRELDIHGEANKKGFFKLVSLIKMFSSKI